MAVALPPTVHGPITPISKSVRVSGILAGANATIYADGAPVGYGGGFGGWVSLSKAVTVNAQITATQKRGDDAESGISQAVPVVAVPDPLPHVEFTSALSNEMSMLRVSGIVPGADVQITKSGGPVIGGLVEARRSEETVHLDLNHGLTPGETLTAVQTALGEVSNGRQSLPLTDTMFGKSPDLRPPVIAEPLTACTTEFDFSDVTASAETKVRHEGGEATWLNLSHAFHAYGSPELKEGKLQAEQVFKRSGRRSTVTEMIVGPAVKPGPPVVTGYFCREIGTVHISSLRAGAELIVNAIVTLPGGTKSTRHELGRAEIDAVAQDFQVPTEAFPANARLSLEVQQSACGLLSESSALLEAPLPAVLPSGAPLIVEPVYDCASFVSLTGASPGARVILVDGGTNVPLSDEQTVLYPQMKLRSWFPLVAEMKVFVRQRACGGLVHESAAVAVLALPPRLPEPVIIEPVVPAATVVRIKACVPGALVTLVYDGEPMGSVEADKENVAFVIPPAADGSYRLKDQKPLYARQTLCSSTGTGEKTPVLVQKGTLKVDLVPPGVQRGQATTLTVGAASLQTSEVLAGLPVVLPGTDGIRTGTGFAFLARLGSPAPNGLVQGSPSYADAPFTVPLSDPPPAPPPPKPKLGFDLQPEYPTVEGTAPDFMRITKAEWTVRYAWAGSETKTGMAVQFEPPPLPSGSQNGSIYVTLKVDWRVYGYYANLIPFDSSVPGTVLVNGVPQGWFGQTTTLAYGANGEVRTEDNGATYTAYIWAVYKGVM